MVLLFFIQQKVPRGCPRKNVFFRIRNISKRKQASEKKHAEHCLRHLNKTACEICSVFDKVLFCVKYLPPFFHRTHPKSVQKSQMECRKVKLSAKKRNWVQNGEIKDVRTYWYCASLERTLYKTWHVPRHVFQVRAPSRNSTKYRADELYGNLISEYFCWMLGDPHFFFGRSLPFLILSIVLKKLCTWEV